MARTLPFALALLPAFALAAPALKERPTAPSIVGEWERTGHTQSGKPVAPDKTGHRQAFTADGDWSYSYGGKIASGMGMTFATDMKQNPPTIDIHTDKSGQAAYRGIYKVERDTLTLCLVMGTGDRPKTFESSPDKPTTIWIFERVKAKE